MKDRFSSIISIYAALALLLGAGAVAAKTGDKIVHDAEYYVLEAQNGEKWAAEDKALDQKLAELQEEARPAAQPHPHHVGRHRFW